MSSQVASNKNSLPDLIVNECLFGCEGCPGIWTNRQMGHRILCRCACGHGRIMNNRYENICLQGPKVTTPTAQAAVVEASTKPTPTIAGTLVNSRLMNAADSKGSSDDVGGNIDANEI